MHFSPLAPDSGRNAFDNVFRGVYNASASRSCPRTENAMQMQFSVCPNSRSTHHESRNKFPGDSSCADSTYNTD